MKQLTIVKILMAAISMLDSTLVTLAVLVNLSMFYFINWNQTLLTKYIILCIGVFMTLEESIGHKLSNAVSDLFQANEALNQTQEFLMKKSSMRRTKETADEKIAIDMTNLKFSYKSDFSDLHLNIDRLSINKGKFRKKFVL